MLLCLTVVLLSNRKYVTKGNTKHNAVKVALSTSVMEFYTRPGTGLYGPNFPSFPQSFETNSGYLIPNHEE